MTHFLFTFSLLGVWKIKVLKISQIQYKKDGMKDADMKGYYKLNSIQHPVVKRDMKSTATINDVCRTL